MYQTFTVKYNGKPYKVSTEFEHVITVNKSGDITSNHLYIVTP